MRSLKTTMLAGAVIAAAFTSANAADLPPVMQAQPIVPVQVAEFGGWYLRGDIGLANRSLKSFSHPLILTAPQYSVMDSGGFDSGTQFGAGVGYQFNSWLRFDFTGEFRGKTGFRAFDRAFNTSTNSFNPDEYTGTQSEYVVMGNAYFDLGTWWNITPFVGGGIGAAFNRFDHFRDVNVSTGGLAFADSGTSTNLAWALHAGASYKVAPCFVVELAYRYLNTGNSQTGNLVRFDGTSSGAALAPFTFHDVVSHDVRFGIRWLLQPEQLQQPIYGQPLMRRG